MNLPFRFFKMMRPYRGALTLGISGLVIASLLSLVTPAIVRQLTARLVAGTADTSAILTFSGILAGAYLLRGVCRYLSMYYNHVAAWRFVGDLTARVYDKLQTLSIRFHSEQTTGELMSRAVNDTRSMEVLLAHALPDLVSNLLVVLGVAVMVFFINPLLAALTLIPVPLVLLMGKYFSKRVTPLFRHNNVVLGELSGLLQDNLSGMKEIQAFGKEGAESRKFRDFCHYYSGVNIRANKANAFFQPTVELLTSLGTVAVLGIGGVMALRGSLSTADIVGFFMYLGLFYQPLTVLARLVEDVQSSFAGGVRVLEILDTEPDVPEAATVDSSFTAQGELTFECVDFHYQQEEPVLADISFTAAPGQMVALVGATGVGKTTLVSLIERFYDPVAGKISLDSIDIKNLPVAALRSQLSIVLQDVFLFNGTVADNIAYGVGSASRGEIEAAAKTAYADGFIREMPQGYDTRVGERGARLSGGQKQRIAIARAVLRDTPVLILDEATSAVDTETEAQIQKAIENLAGSRTVLVIAHRLSTVRKADLILVLENGRVAERGRHEELLALGGIYAKLCQTQDNMI